MIDYCRKHGAIQESPCPKCEAEKPVQVKDPWFSVAGQDLARYRDHSAYASIKIVEGIGRIKRLYIWPHVKYEVVMADTMRFLRLDRVRSFDVDVTNDSKVGEDYQAMGAPIEAVRFTRPQKNDMVEYFRDVGQKGLMKRPTKGPFVEELNAQVAEQERIQGVQETPGYAHPEGRHDDLFWSLMLATRAASPFLTNPSWAMKVTTQPKIRNVRYPFT